MNCVGIIYRLHTRPHRAYL